MSEWSNFYDFNTPFYFPVLAGFWRSQPRAIVWERVGSSLKRSTGGAFLFFWLNVLYLFIALQKSRQLVAGKMDHNGVGATLRHG